MTELLTGCAAGADMSILSTQYGIHRHSVRAHLARAGVAVRAKGLSEPETEEAVRLYAAGLSLVKLSERFGCDHETVRRALKLRGVVLRKPWERL